jgi:hypothetical protein
MLSCWRLQLCSSLSERGLEFPVSFPSILAGGWQSTTRDLEARALRPRIHCTPTVSNRAAQRPERSALADQHCVYFRPVMYAPPIEDEIFDNDR